MPQPDGSTKAALQWADKRLEADPALSRAAAIDEAAQKFGLSPLQAEFLYANVRRQSSAATS